MKFKLFTLTLLISLVFLPAKADMAKMPAEANELNRISIAKIPLNMPSTTEPKPISTKVDNLPVLQKKYTEPQKSAINPKLLFTVFAASGTVIFLTMFLFFISKLKGLKKLPPNTIMDSAQYEISNAVVSFIKHRIRK